MPSAAAVILSTPVEGQEERAQEKLALVIPTLCEAENIGGLLQHVRSVLDPLGICYEILVVDDDSNDGTGEVVSAIAKQDPRVRLLVRKGQRGLSGAILYGWQNTDATILGVMDADLQHPPELLPQLVAGIQSGNDLVIGSRYTPGGDLGKWNPVRKLLSAAAVWVTWPCRSGSSAPRTPCQDFSWFAAVAFSRSRSSSPASSYCLRCWYAGASGRLRRFHLPSAAVTVERAKPASKWAGTMRGCWSGFMQRDSVSAAAREQATERLARAVGQGFIPGKTAAQWMWALAPGVCFSRFFPRTALSPRLVRVHMNLRSPAESSAGPEIPLPPRRIQAPCEYQVRG